MDLVLASSTAKNTDNGSCRRCFDIVLSRGFRMLEGEERKKRQCAGRLSRGGAGLPGVASNTDFNRSFPFADRSAVGLYLDGILLHSPFHKTVSGPAMVH
jgi:hypothetical protein